MDGETKGRVEWENGLDSTDEKFLFKTFCFDVLRENYCTEDEDLHEFRHFCQLPETLAFFFQTHFSAKIWFELETLKIIVRYYYRQMLK